MNKYKAYRQRISDKKLKEIRGLYCPVNKHDEFKEKFKKELEK